MISEDAEHRVQGKQHKLVVQNTSIGLLIFRILAISSVIRLRKIKQKTRSSSVRITFKIIMPCKHCSHKPLFLEKAQKEQ